jgi:hypothetical protein
MSAVLTDEHEQLLSQVSLRVADLLTMTAVDQWPKLELQTLVGYLRAEVSRQAAHEEQGIFRDHPTSPHVAQLNRDHVRLRAGTEVLARAAAGEGSRSTAQLAATARSLLVQLQRHVVAEEQLLTPGGRNT